MQRENREFISFILTAIPNPSTSLMMVYLFTSVTDSSAFSISYIKPSRNLLNKNWNTRFSFGIGYLKMHCGSTKCVLGTITLKGLGHFFIQKAIVFSGDVQNNCNTFARNWLNTMNIWSGLRILMTLCISTRTSVATVLITHSCVYRRIKVQN